MLNDPPNVVVTPTNERLTKRETATAVIAEKLGIPLDQVKDDTPLGDVAHDITLILAFKSGDMMIGNANMTAKDVYDQLT